MRNSVPPFALKTNTVEPLEINFSSYPLMLERYRNALMHEITIDHKAPENVKIAVLYVLEKVVPSLISNYDTRGLYTLLFAHVFDIEHFEIYGFLIHWMVVLLYILNHPLDFKKGCVNYVRIHHSIIAYAYLKECFFTKKFDDLFKSNRKGDEVVIQIKKILMDTVDTTERAFVKELLQSTHFKEVSLDGLRDSISKDTTIFQYMSNLREYVRAISSHWNKQKHDKSLASAKKAVYPPLRSLFIRALGLSNTDVQYGDIPRTDEKRFLVLFEHFRTKAGRHGDNAISGSKDTISPQKIGELQKPMLFPLLGVSLYNFLNALDQHENGYENAGNTFVEMNHFTFLPILIANVFKSYESSSYLRRVLFSTEKGKQILRENDGILLYAKTLLLQFARFKSLMDIFTMSQDFTSKIDRFKEMFITNGAMGVPHYADAFFHVFSFSPDFSLRTFSLGNGGLLDSRYNELEESGFFDVCIPSDVQLGKELYLVVALYFLCTGPSPNNILKDESLFSIEELAQGLLGSTDSVVQYISIEQLNRIRAHVKKPENSLKMSTILSAMDSFFGSQGCKQCRDNAYYHSLHEKIVLLTAQFGGLFYVYKKLGIDTDAMFSFCNLSDQDSFNALCVSLNSTSLFVEMSKSFNELCAFSACDFFILLLFLGKMIENPYTNLDNHAFYEQIQFLSRYLSAIGISSDSCLISNIDALRRMLVPSYIYVDSALPFSLQQIIDTLKQGPLNYIIDSMSEYRTDFLGQRGELGSPFLARLANNNSGSLYTGELGDKLDMFYDAKIFSLKLLYNKNESSEMSILLKELYLRYSEKLPQPLLGGGVSKPELNLEYLPPGVNKKLDHLLCDVRDKIADWVGDSILTDQEMDLFGKHYSAAEGMKGDLGDIGLFIDRMEGICKDNSLEMSQIIQNPQILLECISDDVMEGAATRAKVIKDFYKDFHGRNMASSIQLIQKVPELRDSFESQFGHLCDRKMEFEPDQIVDLVSMTEWLVRNIAQKHIDLQWMHNSVRVLYFDKMFPHLTPELSYIRKLYIDSGVTKYSNGIVKFAQLFDTDIHLYRKPFTYNELIDKGRKEGSFDLLYI